MRHWHDQDELCGHYSYSRKGSSWKDIVVSTPMCLLNVYCKIFTNSLSIGFDVVVDKVGLTCQNTFIKVKIMDGFFSLHKAKLRNNKVWFLRLIQKAYEKVRTSIFLLGNVWFQSLQDQLGVWDFHQFLFNCWMWYRLLY